VQGEGRHGSSRALAVQEGEGQVKLPRALPAIPEGGGSQEHSASRKPSPTLRPTGGRAKCGSRTPSGAQVHPRIQYRAYLAVSSRGLLAGETQEVTCFGVSPSLKTLDQGPSATLSDLRSMNLCFAEANESHVKGWNWVTVVPLPTDLPVLGADPTFSFAIICGVSCSLKILDDANRVVCDTLG
jgi:hypothetical protein